MMEHTHSSSMDPGDRESIPEDLRDRDDLEPAPEREFLRDAIEIDDGPFGD